MKERTSEELTQQEIDLLMRFARGMKERIPSFYSLDPFDPKSSPDSEREYLGWFRFHIQKDALLELIVSFSESSTSRRLRNVSWFAENILAPNNFYFSPNDNTRMKWAMFAREVVQDILGLRRDNGIIQLRNAIIGKLQRRGKMSHEEICKELDLNYELRKNDPILEKWCKVVAGNRRLFSYHAAFIHSRLNGRVKKMISTA